MRSEFELNQYACGHLASTRVTAHSIRESIEQHLGEGKEIVFDFTGIEATQSFVDELIGVLILKYGPDILEKLIFKACSNDVRVVIDFVVNDRADQYIKKNSH